MSARTRPRAPWYSPATRRLARSRIGLPTLVACIVATAGSGVAITASRQAAGNLAAAVGRTTALVGSAVDEHRDSHGHDGAGDRRAHGH
jgi:hypothetical protein